jgi:tetratricopeptide (TPR) repeat protein
LLGDVAAKIELGGTHNPAAFDAYLRARKALLAPHAPRIYQTAIAAYSDAIALDPSYALAFANRSLAFSAYATVASGAAIRESFEKSHEDAVQSLALVPDLSEGHFALAVYFAEGMLDFSRAKDEFELALSLAPGNARILRLYGLFVVQMGSTEAGIAALRHAVTLDPLNRSSYRDLGLALHDARRYDEANVAFQNALTLDPDDQEIQYFRGLSYYALGDSQSARVSCERMRDDNYLKQVCLAMTYDKLGRRADAEAMLAKVKASAGDDAAYQYAEIYAQWGDTSKALEWLEKALRLKDSGLTELKVDPFLDPLRNESRFRAVERRLKFPSN